MSYIQLENVSYAYEGTIGIRNINLSIDKGMIVAIIGHNGAGKTTLLKMIAGRLKEQQGAITVNENSKKIFFLSENRGFFQKLSLRENIIYRSKLLGINSESIDIQLIEHLGATKFLDRPMKNLSQGQKMRGLLILSIITNPQLLLLDEPTNSIDYATSLVLEKELQNMKKEGKTILLVSHDLGFCHSISDEMMILNEGEILSEHLKNLSLEEFKLKYISDTEGAIN